MVKVWYPYHSCAPESPPNRVRWDRWGSILYIPSGETSEAGAKLRIYYHQAQTLEGLDGASSTTVPLQDEEVIVLGAAAFAALQKARSSVVRPSCRVRMSR